MIGFDTDKITEELFESLVQNYQVFEDSMKGSSFLLDGVKRLFYKCQKISINRDGSYIDSPGWLKSKATTIKPKNNDDMCFTYVVTVALNHESIWKHLERISKIRHYIDQYDRKDINFVKDQKTRKSFMQTTKQSLLCSVFIKQ